MLLDTLRGFFGKTDIAIFHQFAPAPGGGGNQFLRALWHEWRRRGFLLENNRIGPQTQACLFNSFNFHFERLKRFRRAACRMVHRVDGPIGVYRGRDDGTDYRIWRINREMADATVFQSRFSLEMHDTLGFNFRSPQIIMNAADPEIFYDHGRLSFAGERKLRVISCSWSDNPNKGASIYAWLDRHLDFGRIEYCFVGRSPVRFEHIRHVAPVNSQILANLLRRSDVFITASRNDPCSNSLIEALSCGLPAIYLDSGGHGEIIGQAGLPFHNPDEIPEKLDWLAARLDDYRQRIRVPSIAETATRYLDVLGLRASSHDPIPTVQHRACNG